MGRGKKKKRLMGFCLAFSLLLFSGCGNRGVESKEEKAEEIVELSLWGAKEDKEFLQQAVASFQEEYKDEAVFDVKIGEESELTCKETVLFNPQAAADVYTFAGDQFKELVEAQALLEITEGKDKVIEENGSENSAAIQAASYEGNLYALPATSSNGYFLFYNSDYLSEEDVQSIDGILKVAEEKNKKFSMDFSSGWYMYSFFKGAGMDAALSEDGVTNVCDFNRTEGKYKGVDVASSMLAIAMNDAFISQDDQTFAKTVKDGEIIARVSGTWNADAVKQAYGDGYATAKLPTYTLAGEQVQMHSVTGFKLVGVNAYTKQPVWAQRLAEWITNEENQELRFSMRGEAPTNVNAASDKVVQANKAVAALAEQAEYAHVQEVADSYWSSMYQYGVTITAGNPDGEDLQLLLDNTVAEIVKPTKEE